MAQAPKDAIAAAVLDEVERLLEEEDDGRARDRGQRVAAAPRARTIAAVDATTSPRVVHAPEETLRLVRPLPRQRGAPDHRGLPRRREDDAGQGARALDRLLVLAPAVHAGPAARPTSRASTSSTSARTSSSSGPARSSRTCCSSTRSTAPRRRRRRRCSSACRRTRSRSTASPTSCRGRSWSWRPRTRSSTRARTRCPRRSSTASPCASRSATRRSPRRRRCSASRRASRRSSAPAGHDAPTRCSPPLDARRRVYVEESLNRYVVALLRHTRADARLYLGASPRAGVALLRVAKARALIGRAATTCCPDDVKAVAVPVLAHRLIVAPEARAAGLSAADPSATRSRRRRSPSSMVRPCDALTSRRELVARSRSRSARALRRRVGVRRAAALPGRRRARARGSLACALGAAARPADAAPPVGRHEEPSTSRATTSRQPRARAGGRRRRRRPVIVERIGGSASADVPSTARAAGCVARYALRRVPRGPLPARATRAVLEDPFGLARRERALAGRRRAARLPAARRARALFSRGRRGRAGGPAAAPAPADRLRPPQRARVPGGRVAAASVHWPSTAQRGRLMVKDLEDAPRDEVAVVLDADAAARRRRAAATRASTCRCAPPARSCARTPAAAGARPRPQRRGRADAARPRREARLAPRARALAAVEPNADTPRSRALARAEAGPRARAELAVVTARLPPRARRPAGPAGARPPRRRRSSTSTPRASPARDGSATPSRRCSGCRRAGVPVAVLRRGDDLLRRLGGLSVRKVAHG